MNNTSISFWQSQLGLPGKDEPPAAPVEIETELCIVGGGIIGAGLAHWAAQQGLSGVVVEAREAALGASGRNAGFVLSGIAASYDVAVQHYGRDAARELWALSIENRNVMLALAEQFGVFHWRCGCLLLAESVAEAEALERSATLLHEDGFAGTFVADALHERGFFAGLQRAEDGVTQPAALSRALLQQSGFDTIFGSPVLSIEESSEGVIVRSARATVRARWAMLATNAWSATLHPYFEGKVTPMRGQVYVTEPAPMSFDTAGYSHYGYWYFRQVPTPERPGYGRWLIGGGRHLHFDTENNKLSEQPSAPVQADLEAWTARHFPEFAEVPIAQRWAGVMGFTADGLPLVGTLPDHKRVGFAVGFNGHGMGLGVLVAKQALALLLEGTPTPLFDARRLEG